MGFLIKIQQILKRFSGTKTLAKILYFWGVSSLKKIPLEVLLYVLYELATYSDALCVLMLILWYMKQKIYLSTMACSWDKFLPNMQLFICLLLLLLRMHSSQFQSLCSTKSSSKMIQNLPYFIQVYENPKLLFPFCISYYFIYLPR